MLSKGEMKWCVQVLCCAPPSRLPPSRGDSRLSPVTVVGVAGHGGRVLGQAGALGRLGHGVEPRLPHRSALPQAGAPLLLSALHAAAAAAVHSVHLSQKEKKKKRKEKKTFTMCNFGTTSKASG